MPEILDLPAALLELIGDLRPASAVSEADVSALRELATDANVMMSRRELPVFSTQPRASVPLWANGRAIERTIGPFLDRIGRAVWIDLFRVVRHVRLVRSAGAAPFATLPITLVARRLPAPPPSEYALPEGSVWIAGALLASGVPATAYTGLAIRGGRVRFSQPIAITGDEVVVPGSVVCTLALELRAEAAPGGSGDGADARAARCRTPATATLVVDSAGARFTAIGAARAEAYGTATELAPTTGATTYLGELSRVAVPMSSSAATFEARTVASRVFQPSGSAPIAWAAWGLPVAVIEWSKLGEASGSGNLLLGLGDGLGATWTRQPQPAALGPTIVMLDPARLVVVAAGANASGARQELALWKGPAPNRVLLRYGSSFALRFFAQATGTEALWVIAGLDATLDRPVDVRGDRIGLRARAANVVFIADPSGVTLQVRATLEAPSAVVAAVGFDERLGIAIKNAVFVVGRAELFALALGLDGAFAGSGACWIRFPQRALVPTLPDPYASNLGSLPAALDQASEPLDASVRWTAAAAPVLDFAVAGGPTFVPTTDEIVPVTGDVPGEEIGDAFWFERDRRLILLDVSTHTDQFGVAIAPTGRGSRSWRSSNVRDLYLERRDVTLVTLPAVQWEALITVSDPDDPSFPPRLGFDTSGVPTAITVPTATMVPVHPRAALDALIANFAEPDPRPARARFTLPFGMVASAVLDAPTATAPRGATLSSVRPRSAELEGGHQLSIRAVDRSLPPSASPSLPGHTVQLRNGQPGFRSALGSAVTPIFNSYLGAGGPRPLVPIARLDLSGYGESVFSDWRNPYGDPEPLVTQARFDVLIGRTAHEVVQVRSRLFPYGVAVVRTITIERRSDAVVTRRDSGWQAVSDGRYEFPKSSIETHPGVVTRITDVGNIRSTGATRTVDGILLAEVRFDGDLVLDGAPAKVPARGQIGYVQLTAPAAGLLSPASYAKLIALVGAMGGPIDAEIDVGGGGQKMRVRRVGVGVTDPGAPAFVMAAWGSPAFPRGGDWSFLRLTDPLKPPIAVPRDGVPLIRAGRASAGPPPSSSAYRFADPIDLAQPTAPASDYGILHATGTQRAFFPRPSIAATDATRIGSSVGASVADPYGLATSLYAFPELVKAIPMPAGGWALRIGAGGGYRLEQPASPFPVTVGRRTLHKAGSIASEVDYGGAQVTYELDTAQPVPWRFSLTGARTVMASSTMGDLITVSANLRASADRATEFGEPRVALGGAFSVVQDILTLLEDLGAPGAMSIEMTNELSLKCAMKYPFKDPVSLKDYQIPPYPTPHPAIKFIDTEMALETKLHGTGFEGELKFGGKPLFLVGFLGPAPVYAAAMFELSFAWGTEHGSTWGLAIGLGFAIDFDLFGLEATGVAISSIFGFTGTSANGYGVGFLVELTIDLKIAEVSVSAEVKLAIVTACPGAPNRTVYGVGILKLAAEVTLGFFFSISFEWETKTSKVIGGDGDRSCELPDVIP